MCASSRLTSSRGPGPPLRRRLLQFVDLPCAAGSLRRVLAPRCRLPAAVGARVLPGRRLPNAGRAHRGRVVLDHPSSPQRRHRVPGGESPISSNRPRRPAPAAGLGDHGDRDLRPLLLGAGLAWFVGRSTSLVAPRTGVGRLPEGSALVMGPSAGFANLETMYAEVTTIIQYRRRSRPPRPSYGSLSGSLGTSRCDAAPRNRLCIQNAVIPGPRARMTPHASMHHDAKLQE